MLDATFGWPDLMTLWPVTTGLTTPLTASIVSPVRRNRLLRHGWASRPDRHGRAPASTAALAVGFFGSGNRFGLRSLSNRHGS